MQHQFAQFNLILWSMEPPVEGGTTDLTVEPLLHLLHRLHCNRTIFDPVWQDRVVAHEARTIFHHQNAVTELDRMGNLAAIDQLRLGLEQTEQFLAILDRLALEDPASSHVTDMDRPIQIIEQFGSESGHPILESCWERSRSARVRASSGRGPRIRSASSKKCPVSLRKPRLGVAPFGFRDLIDRSKMCFNTDHQMMMLSPAAHSEKVRKPHRSPYDDSQTVADQAGIGGIVDVGFEDERVAADRFHGRGDESMSLGHDLVVDPLDGVGRDQRDVVVKKHASRRSGHDPSRRPP